MSKSEVSLSHDAFFTGEFMKQNIIFLYVEFKPFKGALYSGTIVDDIHIAYIFANILYLVLIHKIQNKVISRIELFKA